MYLSRILLKAKESIIGSDYGYACPDAIQINMNKVVCLSGKRHAARSVMVMCCGSYANGPVFSLTLTLPAFLSFFFLYFFSGLGVVFRG